MANEKSEEVKELQKKQDELKASLDVARSKPNRNEDEVKELKADLAEAVEATQAAEAEKN